MKMFTMITLALLTALPVLAQESADPMKAAEEAYAAAGAPGAWHEFFAKRTGTWNVASKMWMQPGADPMESEAVAEFAMILDGRFLQETFKGEFMGQPFEGLSISGYDNTSGLVTTTWFDSMNTATTVLTGKGGEPGTALEQTGTQINPAMGMEMQLRTVTTYVSEDETRFEYFMSMDPMPEMKAMEMTYTRVP